MGKDPVAADWPPLTDEEVRSILLTERARSGLTVGGSQAVAPPVVCWRSPRPWSAAGLVNWRGRRILVKRHHILVRTAAQLGVEHAFAAHLRARGCPVPAQVRFPGGLTAVVRGPYVYEAQEQAAGVDSYRDAASWSPYASTSHAWSAGAELARLHVAAASFDRAERAACVLMGSCALVLAADPFGQLEQTMVSRPGLARSLANRSWRESFASELQPAIARAGTLCRRLPRQWGHGDWHPSNLGWTSPDRDARVASVFDLGLANRTFAVHDLATAIERSAISWLDLADSGQAKVDYAGLGALLDGYESVRTLSPDEAAALVALLPVVHVEFALSELEYFDDVVHSAANASLAYDGYLLGHARWFAAEEGSAILDRLAARWLERPASPVAQPAKGPDQPGWSRHAP